MMSFLQTANLDRIIMRVNFFGCYLIVSLLGVFQPLFSESTSFHEVIDKNPLKVLTPTLQDRKTAKIQLKNGLQVLIISDPMANKSAAALSVEVGCWQDPVLYPGMAHFCEHMLFMGSKKYPDEDGFFHGVTDSGGSANAYTWTDRTVYGFSSNHKQFNQNLDVFAHFFIDPLFAEKSVSKELLAVNQEYAKNIENDGWREWQIFKERGNQKHPNAKFSTGNEETLKVIPVQTLANWYRLHYSADKMHLVIYTNQDLPAMKEIVNATFSTIPTANPPPLAYDVVMSEDQRGSIIYIEPVQDLRSISFTWEMSPQVASDIDAKVPEILAYTLSYKGEDSLFESLYRQSLIESLNADVLRMSPNQALLVFSINLTKKGVENLDAIIDETFGMVRQLEKSGVPHHVFQEMRKMGEINYKWQQRSEEFNFAMGAASQLIDENLETYPYKTIVIQTMKPSLITSTFSQMTPQETLISVIAPSTLTKIVPDQREKWLGGEYRIVALGGERLDRLSNLSPNLAISPPKSNPFVPDALSVRKKEQKPEAVVPKILSDDTFGKCYFMEDEHYLVPEVVMKFGIKSPAIRANVKSAVMADIAAELLNRNLITMTSEAQRGGITTSIYHDGFKLFFTIRGPVERSELVLSRVADGIKTLCPTLNEFELIKESLSSEYENRQRILAFFQAKDTMNSILHNDDYSGKDLATALKMVSFEDYLIFNEEFIQTSYVEGAIGGNLGQSEAMTLWISLKNTLKSSVYPYSEQYQSKTLLLSNNNGPCTLALSSEMQGNASLLMIQIPTTSISKIASQEILSQVLWSSFFDTLRTKQQTAYIAKAWTEESDDKIMLFFGVHSTTHYPIELLARFELYLEEYLRNFETEMPLARFESLKETVITNLSKPPTNLNNKIGQLYFFAFEKHGDFERRQRTIEAIQALDYNTFKEDVSDFFSRQNTKRLAVLVEGKQASDKSFAYRSISYEQAKSL